jgi:replicative DNA helicase
MKQKYDIDFAREYIMQPAPVPTGVPALDKALGGGMPSGTFTVIAGEAGCGKSALACMMAYQSALSKRTPIFFSHEMPASMVISRMLSIHTATIRRRQMTNGTPDDKLMSQVWWSSNNNLARKTVGHEIVSDWEVKAYIENHGANDPTLVAWESFKSLYEWMIINDSTKTVSDACGVIDEVCAVGIRPLVILDYLQLGADMDGDGSEYERVTKASGRLLSCIKQWRIPAVIVSSMRNIGRDELKEEPRLSWLRSSGRIGYDAGTAIIIKRAGERNGNEQPIDAFIVKNRVGPSGGKVPLIFNGGLNEFRERGNIA